MEKLTQVTQLVRAPRRSGPGLSSWSELPVPTFPESPFSALALPSGVRHTPWFGRGRG